MSVDTPWGLANVGMSHWPPQAKVGSWFGSFVGPCLMSLGENWKTDAFQASGASVVSTVESAALDLVGQVSLVGCSSGISPGLCGVRGTFCERSAERSVDVLRRSVDVLRNVLWTFCVVPWTFCAVLMSQRQLSCESPQIGSQSPVLVQNRSLVRGATVRRVCLSPLTRDFSISGSRFPVLRSSGVLNFSWAQLQ